MAANIEEEFIEKLRALPPEKQQEVLEFVEKLGRQGSSATKPTGPMGRMSIWEKIADIVNEVPPGDWDDLPPDGSINIDHYLYGATKKE